jgi:hypothetical protein
MGVALSTKYLIKIVLSFLFLITLIAIASPSEVTDYDSLNGRWLMEALSGNPQIDPRLDGDRLRPVLNYDVEVIQVHSFKKEPQRFLVGEGWQLAGAVVDIIRNENSTYILYGRRNLHFKGGLWNNTLDSDQSFDDYLIVKREDNQTEVLVHERLIPTTSEILIGFRLTSNGEGFELLQNSPSGYPQVVWSYQF